ncbi:MAG TPA: 1,4-beta-xylanase, partial [Balneolaceae bacterium]|nr:1,4-beta-xylanase [Balneolaceae bacterium]
FEDEHGDPLTRDALLARMEDHIKTVMGRYKGRVDGWDVVNEALNDDGTMRESPWYTIIGEDYLAKAFQFAKEADPEAELYYNDYNLHLPAKADAAVALVRSIQEQGIEVTGIGMQGHYGMDYPTAEDFDSSITKFKKLGVVAITELDIDVLPSPWEHMGADVNMTAELRDELNPFTKGLPDSVLDVQTRQFEMLFKVMLEHADAINRVTLWGVTDGDSWKNGWPMPGRTNYPLLFDRNGKPKPAVPKIVELAK